MEFRILLPSDYEDAMLLWNDAVGVGINPDDSKEYFEKYLQRNPNTSFAAIENNKLVGAIMAGHDGYRGYIHHTAVVKDFRCKGIGTKLVNLALNAIKNEGINKIALVAFKNNSSGNSFWEKQGFKIRDDLYYRNIRVNNL
ncbi:MAG: GNAT family N-acetyltransferase [Hominimerdicola sp.]